MADPSTVPVDPSAPGSAPHQLTRRRFLGTALGSAAALAACTPAETDTTPSPSVAGTSPTGTSSPSTSATPSPTATGGGGGGGGGGATTPTAVDETWTEPWVWRPADWPGQSLDLNIVENQNPGPVIGMGNAGGVLFSYGGQTPGPTIRVRGDATLAVTLRNLLGPDGGTTFVGVYPDPKEITGYLDGKALDEAAIQALAASRGQQRADFCLGEHTNGPHTTRSTNLHTHGLHVRPGRNPDGTHSDNVILRLIPQGDLAAREADAGDGEISCRFLRAGDEINFLADDDQVGQADYEFRLGGVQGRANQPHPPGTHWYHPHSHGSTHNQVASGMAGFLIVEGDVDDAIRAALVPDRDSDPGDPERKTGPHDYRERLILVQRVLLLSSDVDAPEASLQTPPPKVSQPSGSAVNGLTDASTIIMRPRATERWRVLNGSVDGQGFRRFMVLEGRYGVDANDDLAKLDDDGTIGDTVTRAEIETAKQQLFQLAVDGVTLVSADGTYQVKDLAQQGDPDATFPLADYPNASPEQLAEDWAACFADGDAIRNSFVRPNEVYLGPANRTDVFFSPPALADGQERADFTIVALGVVLHADTTLQGAQQGVAAPATRALDGTVSQPATGGGGSPADVILGYVVVSGDAAEPADVTSIDLPDVPPYLQPITDDDPGLVAPDGGFRTRSIVYSGWGAQGLPLVTATLPVDDTGTPTGPGDQAADANAAALAEFIMANPDLAGLRYVRRTEPADGQAVFVLLPPNTRTMAIDGRKFDPHAPGRPRMYLGSAEEWVVSNDSDWLWGDTGPDSLPAAQYNGHYVGQSMTLAEGMAAWRDDPGMQVLTRSVDHPFHIHQNPFWVIRIDVPDADGTLHNILDEPRWMDVVPVPRHRGRVVFRSRFPDYVGTYVNHCHILLHEDNGMMQVVEVTPFDSDTGAGPGQDVDSARANYVVRDALAPGGQGADGPDRVTELYGRSTPGESWVRNMSFVDANHSTGQEYPGFSLTPPG